MSNSGQKSGKPMEKSNFAQTCNLLSSYLKEKRSMGDNISLGMTGTLETTGLETRWPPTTTMNLLPNLENPAETSRQNSGASSNMKSMDFLTQIAGSGPSNFIEDSTNNLRKPEIMEHGTAPMTIFYAGKVLVFNDFPADKAREIMALASKGSSTFGMDKTNPSSSNIVPDLNIVSTPTINPTQQRLRPQANGSDFPIVSKASLQRFFEKRKVRVAAKAPYQVHNSNNSAAVPPKPKASHSGVDEEGQSSNQLELKLQW